MTTRILIALVATSLTTAIAQTSDNSFAGKWKLNQEKSQLSGFTYKVEDAGKNKITFKSGDTSETLSLDGTPHTTRFGDTWSITKKGTNTFHWVRKRNGKTTSDATWTVAEDAATSTYDDTVTRPDGSTSHDVATLKRTEGSGPGLVGTWESTNTKIGSPVSIEIEKSGTDGYLIKDVAYKQETKFKTDGKAYTPKGPNVAPGTTVSAKQQGDNNMELTYKIKGKVSETDNWELSSDGKTLTETITYPGENKKEVDIFERE